MFCLILRKFSSRPDHQNEIWWLKKARKGIFIATSTFPRTAHDFVSTLEQKIILIDGERLTDLMFEFNIGLSTQSVYEIKKIDFDYFEE